MARAQRARGTDADKPEGVAADEPLPEWENDLLQQGAGSDGASLTDTAPAEAAVAAAPASTTNGASQSAN
jgi:small subunit ribosomal protein S2